MATTETRPQTGPFFTEAELSNPKGSAAYREVGELPQRLDGIVATVGALDGISVDDMMTTVTTMNKDPLDEGTLAVVRKKLEVIRAGTHQRSKYVESHPSFFRTQSTPEMLKEAPVSLSDNPNRGKPGRKPTGIGPETHQERRQREFELYRTVVELTGQGLDKFTIAHRMGVPDKTIDHWQRLREKDLEVLKYREAGLSRRQIVEQIEGSNSTWLDSAIFRLGGMGELELKTPPANKPTDDNS